MVVGEVTRPYDLGINLGEFRASYLWVLRVYE